VKTVERLLICIQGSEADKVRSSNRSRAPNAELQIVVVDPVPNLPAPYNVPSEISAVISLLPSRSIAWGTVAAETELVALEGEMEPAALRLMVRQLGWSG
jgi:hypothetical protein